MTHAALDEILAEIHKDLYYFTKHGSHRTMVEDHFAKLQQTITLALAAEYAAGALEQAKKEVRCRS